MATSVVTPVTLRRSHGYHLGVGSHFPFEVFEVDFIIRRNAEVVDLDAEPFLEHEPRNDVGVVFGNGNEHAVASVSNP